jgi:DNA-directed RNA polymerase specialized sigma24 family protein
MVRSPLSIPRGTRDGAPSTGLVHPSQENTVMTSSEIASLYRLHTSSLRALAYSILKSYPDAEDVVQEVFLELVLNGHAITAPRKEVRMWLTEAVTWLAKHRFENMAHPGGGELGSAPDAPPVPARRKEVA